MIISKPCHYRLIPMAWALKRLGVPPGFKDASDWRLWVMDVLDDAGLTEEWLIIVNDTFSALRGYIAYQEGYCIHHKGKVLDIQMLVLAPHCRETRQVWKSILESAKRNGYSWVARRQHQPDGSIKTIFTEV